jgi:sn-glycerol 3-phosphate transport system ATP-binding protein
MAAISLRNVIKRYGTGPKANQVIHGVNAEIADREFVVIVGPSGCGKSTLLRMVAGLEEISGGEIAIGERVVNDIEPSERDIAMVFQNYALYPHMTVFDNMAYGLKIAKVPVAEIKARVDKAAGILQLAPYLARKPRELSGGQRQRVAMGRAIVRQPQVFLFDEPLSNLDAKLRAQTRIEIRKLHAELGVTSLFVTHDQVEAMTLAQRMIVMNAGRMEQFGTPDEVYARPATTFVASFIGSPPMNLLTGHADGSRFTLDGQTLALPAPAPRNGELTLGLRPEHVVAGHAEGWPLSVELIEMLGAERLVHGQLGQHAFTLRMDGMLPPPATGSTVQLQLSAQHLHWFDVTTGARVE